MARTALGSSGQQPDAGLARDLSELARELRVEPDMDGLLQRIAETACAEIEAADWAGITEVVGKRFLTRAATDPLVREVDTIQYAGGDGPCVSSLRDQHTVRANDLSTETRWPNFASEAHARGVTSMLSVQLFVEGDNLGALNLYNHRAAAFDEDDENAAMLLAAHAAVAMQASKVEGNLRTALQSRDVIGQAKGILMERYKIGQAEAFDLLVLASQRGHRKLREVADHLTSTGEIPLS